MTEQDIIFLDQFQQAPADILYDPDGINNWKNSVLPKGTKFASVASTHVNCPPSTFKFDIYAFDHMGNGYQDCPTAEDAVKALKHWLGTEDTENRDRLLKLVPVNLVDMLKSLKDEEQIEGESDFDCKWTIMRDIRTIYSDDLWRVLREPTLRLEWTESGASSVTIDLWSIFGGELHKPCRTWYFPNPECLVSALKGIFRINSLSAIVEELKRTRSCDALSFKGTLYSNNDVDIVQLNHSKWAIDHNGKHEL